MRANRAWEGRQRERAREESWRRAWRAIAAAAGPDRRISGVEYTPHHHQAAPQPLQAPLTLKRVVQRTWRAGAAGRCSPRGCRARRPWRWPRLEVRGRGAQLWCATLLCRPSLPLPACCNGASHDAQLIAAPCACLQRRDRRRRVCRRCLPLRRQRQVRWMMRPCSTPCLRSRSARRTTRCRPGRAGTAAQWVRAGTRRVHALHLPPGPLHCTSLLLTTPCSCVSPGPLQRRQAAV